MTLAHEYNHILQFGYDAYQDAWFAESTAVWMEDQVYNGINDYLRYVRRWVKLYDTPLTANSIKEYGSAVWNEWLAHHYGRAIIRDAWARRDRTPSPAASRSPPTNSAIHAAGHSDFSHDFTRFAADVAEWRTGHGFRESDPYPDMPRQGTLPLDGRALDPLAQPHHLPAAPRPRRAGPAVVVHAVAPQGIAAGLALVGRIGSERHGRTVSAVDFSRTAAR